MPQFLSPTAMTKKKQDKFYVGHPVTLASTQQIVALMLIKYYVVLIRSNKMQQYAGIYLLQIYSTRFGCPSRPSSGVHKTVIASSGTGHIT